MEDSNQSPPVEAFRFRLRLMLDSGDGTEVEVDLELEESLCGPFDGQSLVGLPARVMSVLERQFAPPLRRALRDWANERVPTNADSFEEEFVRRCDSNDRMIRALEWMDPPIETDKDREWKSRMLEVVMAERANEEVR